MLQGKPCTSLTSEQGGANQEVILKQEASLSRNVQDATRKSLITATAASSLLGCVIMGECLDQSATF